MNDFLNLLETLSNISEYEEQLNKASKETEDIKEIENDLESIDLSTDEGLEKFNKSLDELNNYDLGIFGVFLDELRDLGSKLHDKLKEAEKKKIIIN